jgi:hypothetical protein
MGHRAVLRPYLHGMEHAITEGYSKSHAVEKPLLVRYADDFVVFHSELKEVQKVAERVTQWLAQMGLKLSPTKTRTTHTLTPYQEHVGFDFLGFTIRQFPAGKTHTGKGTTGKALGFQTLITPSKEAAYLDHQSTTPQVPVSLARATDQRTKSHHLGMGSLLQNISSIGGF